MFCQYRWNVSSVMWQLPAMFVCPLLVRDCFADTKPILSCKPKSCQCYNIGSRCLVNRYCGNQHWLLYKKGTCWHILHNIVADIGETLIYFGQYCQRPTNIGKNGPMYANMQTSSHSNTNELHIQTIIKHVHTCSSAFNYLLMHSSWHIKKLIFTCGESH